MAVDSIYYIFVWPTEDGTYECALANKQHDSGKATKFHINPAINSLWIPNKTLMSMEVFPKRHIPKGVYVDAMMSKIPERQVLELPEWYIDKNADRIMGRGDKEFRV